MALLFLSLSLAGCLSGSSSCETIVFPAVGASVAYSAEFLDSQGKVRDEGVREYSVLREASVLRGDGQLRDVLVVRREGGGALHHIDRVTGDDVGYEPMAVPVSDLQLNRASALTGNWFFGRCLAEGDEWQLNRGVPGFDLTFHVESASATSIEAWVVAAPVPAAVKGIGGMDAVQYRYEWQSSRLFPDQIYVFSDNESTRPVARYLQESQASVFSNLRVTHEATKLPRPSEVLRWPDFATDLPMNLTFEQFVQNVESRAEVAEYLERHPDAYAAFVEYQDIDETDSHATRWTALLRDGSDEAALVELVRRCFDNQTYAAVWGACRDSTWYYGDDRDEHPAIVPIAASTKVPDLRSISAQQALALAGKFEIGVAPVAIQWRAYPHEASRDEFAFNEGRPGWLLQYGQILGQVEYTWPYGPRGISLAPQTHSMPIDGVGWVLEHWSGPT